MIENAEKGKSKDGNPFILAGLILFGVFLGFTISRLTAGLYTATIPVFKEISKLNHSIIDESSVNVVAHEESAAIEEKIPVKQTSRILWDELQQVEACFHGSSSLQQFYSDIVNNPPPYGSENLIGQLVQILASECIFPRLYLKRHYKVHVCGPKIGSGSEEFDGGAGTRFRVLLFEGLNMHPSIQITNDMLEADYVLWSMTVTPPFLPSSSQEPMEVILSQCWVQAAKLGKLIIVDEGDFASAFGLSNDDYKDLFGKIDPLSPFYAGYFKRSFVPKLTNLNGLQTKMDMFHSKSSDLSSEKIIWPVYLGDEVSRSSQARYFPLTYPASYQYIFNKDHYQKRPTRDQLNAESSAVNQYPEYHTSSIDVRHLKHVQTGVKHGLNDVICTLRSNPKQFVRNEAVRSLYSLPYIQSPDHVQFTISKSHQVKSKQQQTDHHHQENPHEIEIHLGEASHGTRQEISNAYFDSLQRHKIIVTTQPALWEGDFRLWETLATSAAVIMVDPSYVPMPHPLQHNRHVLFFNPLDYDYRIPVDPILLNSTDSKPTSINDVQMPDFFVEHSDLRRKLTRILMPSLTEPGMTGGLNRIALSGLVHTLRYHMCVNMIDYIFYTMHDLELRRESGQFFPYEVDANYHSESFAKEEPISSFQSSQSDNLLGSIRENKHRYLHKTHRSDETELFDGVYHYEYAGSRLTHMFRWNLLRQLSSLTSTPEGQATPSLKKIAANVKNAGLLPYIVPVWNSVQSEAEGDDWILSSQGYGKDYLGSNKVQNPVLV